MTGLEAITQSQQQLNDEGSSPHVTVDHWYSYITAGIRFLSKEHPECLSGSTIVTSAPAAITAANVGEELPITSDFDNNLVQFMCSRALDEDSEASGNMTLSNHHLNKVEAGA